MKLYIILQHKESISIYFISLIPPISFNGLFVLYNKFYLFYAQNHSEFSFFALQEKMRGHFFVSFSNSNLFHIFILNLLQTPSHTSCLALFLSSLYTKQYIYHNEVSYYEQNRISPKSRNGIRTN